MSTLALLSALLVAQAAQSGTAPAPAPAPAGTAATPAAPAAPQPTAPPAAPPATSGAPGPTPPTVGDAATAPPGSLTLQQCLREVLARNPDLKVLAQRVSQSQELSWRAWSAYLPRVVAGGSWTHYSTGDVSLQLPAGFAIRDVGAPAGDPNAGLPGTPTPYALVPTGVQDYVVQKGNQLGAQVDATQALIAPQAIFGISAAAASERAAAGQIESARRDLLFGVAQVFYGAAGAKQAVSVAERLLALERDREKDARIRYQAGTTPKVSLLRAQIDRAGAEADLKRAQNAYASARVALATLMDRRDASFEVVVPPPPPQPPEPATLEERAPEQRPDVIAAREQVSAAERYRNSVLARYAPALGAFARWQWANVAGFTGQYNTWSAGFALTWTLLDGGLRESDLRDAQSRLAEAEAALVSAENRAVDDVRRTRLDLDSAVENRAKSQERVDLARENYKLVDVNFRAGAATYLEVADASTQLTSAEIQLISDSINADLAAIRLLKVAGIWRPGL